MKKLVSLMLALVMIFSLTTCGFAAVKEPPSAVTISADKSFTGPVTTYAENVVSGLFSLVNAAKRTSVKESQVTELAILGFSTFLSGNQAEDVPYTIYKAADGTLYTMKNNRLCLIADSEAFYRLVDESGIQFYMYRAIPAAKVDSTTALCKNASDYQFKKLDGIFYKTKFVPDECGVILNDNSAIPIPEFSIKPKSVKVSVSYNSKDSSQVVWSGDLSGVNSFKPEKSGDHTVKYTAIYESPYYMGEVVYSCNVRYSVGLKFHADGLALEGDAVVTAPGEVVVLRAVNVPENEKVSLKSDINYAPSFFKGSNGDTMALLPVSYYTAPGNYYVELSCGGVVQRFAVKVASRKFIEQYLTVPPSTADATINSQKANDEFENNIAPIRYVSDNKQYWSGRFIWPLKDLPRRTTEFGTIRYTNGDMKNPSRHGAIDFAAAAGTPVYAPNAGRVLYSGFLQLTGHTICIEHGFGLKTWYYHMNGRNVKTGEMVKQGQQIGTVGSTGFSTGAHLHYGMSVSNTVSGNVWINPETSVSTDLFFISDSANG